MDHFNDKGWCQLHNCPECNRDLDDDPIQQAFQEYLEDRYITKDPYSGLPKGVDWQDDPKYYKQYEEFKDEWMENHE